MRLLKIDSSGQLSITKDLVADQIPPYAILSHTWGADEDEVTFQDFNDLSMEKVRSKLGYRKLCFCRDMAREAGLQYFWVDTCCINRADHSELSEAIVSMFQWYANSERCFVYLSDVSAPRHMQSQAVSIWESSFCESRWLTRGWTLQELLAPKSVNFYSRENELLGNKNTLAECIHRATGIPQEALRGAHLPSFSVKERLQWAERRNTRKIEDKAYCLLGIFGVYMWLCYGEGENAWKRLQAAIEDSSKHKQQILESLDFGSPFTRVNKIEKALDCTFAWIFDHDCSGQPHGFLEWLRGGHGLFWIRGKPGSGKSTFIKFLHGTCHDDEETLRYLNAWASPRSPQIITFYFWLADNTKLQNSFRGFACHLLYQLLLDQSPEFVSDLILSDGRRPRRSIDNWDIEELQQLLKAAVTRIASHTPLCFFVDGLDECLPSDLDRVIETIEDLVRCCGSDIKFCVSSRPEHSIERRIRKMSHESLDFHTITKRDIRRYVATGLDRYDDVTDFDLRDEEKQHLINTIVDASEGVFLWAVLVTRRLCTSIDLGDTFHQLCEQLKEVPHDMTQLFHDILQRSGAMDQHRRAEAASYFMFTLGSLEWTLFHKSVPYDSNEIRLPCHSQLSRFLPLYNKLHGTKKGQDWKTAHERLRLRVSRLCGDLLTIESDPHIRDCTVNFFHRTAYDFFQEGAARKFLDESPLSQSDLLSLTIDGICGNGHSLCGGSIGLFEARDMITWCQEIQDHDNLDRTKLLLQIDNAVSECRALKYGVMRNWAFHDAKLCDWTTRAVDFISLAFMQGSNDLLSHHMSNGARLSQTYKDYLLLCAAYNSRGWIPFLLDEGARPNASYYWDLQDRIKTSPWIELLLESRYNINFGDFNFNDIDFNVLGRFLDHGADLHDRTIILPAYYGGIWHRQSLASVEDMIATNSSNFWVAVLEVNAAYLLERLCRHITDSTKNAEKQRFFARHDMRTASSFRRIHAITSTLSKGKKLSNLESRYALSDTVVPSQTCQIPCALVNRLDSERILDGEEWLPVELMYGIEACNRRKSKRMIEEIIDRSPKHDDMRQYLEEIGYCRPADHPDVLQEPIPMFEDPG